MRHFVRPIAALLAAVALATCGETATDPTEGSGRVGVAPVMTAAAAAVNARLADFGITYDRARIVVVRSPADTVKDTTVTVSGAVIPATVLLTVNGTAIGQAFIGNVDIGNASGVLFHGTTSVQVEALNQTVAQSLSLSYVGPGATVARIVISPKAAGLVAPASQAYIITGLDAAGASVAVVPVKWTATDVTVATIAPTGQLQTTGKRGSLSVAASTLIPNIVDSAAVTVTLPPTAISLVSGGSQTGKVSSALNAQAVVKVTATDGVGVSGTTVTFSAPVGGSVSTTTVLTDVNGNASTSLTLGSATGAESFSAVAAGFSVAIPATATAGDPTAISIVSGSAQTKPVLQQLAAPLMVKVVDNAGNPTSGITVTWVATSATLATATSITDATGTASNALTLGALAGPASATASITGAQAPNVTFTATAQPGAVAKLAFSASPVGGTAGIAIAPLHVELRDASGNLTSAIDPVTLALGTGTSGVLAGTLTRAAVAGVATFDNLTVTPVGTYSLTATSASSPALTSTPFDIVAPTIATQLLLVPGTPTSIVLNAGVTPTNPPVVRAVDANGTPVPSVSVLVQLALASNPGQILTHATITTDASGIAAGIVASLGTPPTVAGAYVVTTTSAAIPGASVALNITVLPAAAFKLAITTPPTSAVSGAALTTQPVIQVQDQFGNAVADGTLSVTATPSTGSATGNLMAANATTGVATFTSLMMIGTGSITLAFSAPGLQSVTSAAITMANTLATQLFLSPATPTSLTYVAGVVPAAPPVFKVTDAGGVGIANVPVHVVLTNSVAATLQDVTPMTDANGLVSFVSGLPTVVGTYTFTATTTSVSGALVAVPVTITPAAASQLVFTSQPTGALVGTAVPAFAVQVRDAFGNLVPSATNAVTLSVATGPVGTVLSGTSATAVAGVATFSASSATLDGPYTLTASSSPLTAATSASFTMTDVRSMSFAVAPSAAQTNGLVLSPQPSIQLTDSTASHNPVHKAGVVITATVAPAAGSTGGILNNTATFTRTGTVTASTNANGVATFSNLGILSTQGGLTGEITFTKTSGTTNAIADITADVVVNAGAATTIQGSSSLLLSTVVGTPLATYPTVRLFDLAGSPVPHASAVSISFSVVSGSCTTTAVLTTTAADGTASLSSSNLTLPGAAGSCVVRATSAALSGSPIDFDIVVGPATGFTWLGSSSNDFTNSANWLGDSTPTSGANIFVPKSVPNSPTTAAATSVSALTLEAGAAFTVGSSSLAVTGTTSAGTGSTITVSSGASAEFGGASTTLANLGVNSGLVQFDHNATITGNAVASGTATIKHPVSTSFVLTIAGPLISDVGTTLSGLRTISFTGSTFPIYGNGTSAGAPLITQISANMTVPNGSIAVGGELVVLDAALSLSGSTSLTAGSLDVKSSTGASGEVLMTSGNPTLTVMGVAVFEGKAQQGQGLTIGTLDLQGDFHQRDRTSGSHGEFEPGPNFLVEFTYAGSSQSVLFDHPGTSAPTQSYFTNVLVTNQGGVTQSSHMYINGGVLTIGGPPADAGTPAMWATGFGSNDLFITGGGSVLIEQSGLLTVTPGGALDLTGGSCRVFNSALVVGNAVGGTCTIDTSLNH